MLQFNLQKLRLIYWTGTLKGLVTVLDAGALQYLRMGSNVNSGLDWHLHTVCRRYLNTSSSEHGNKWRLEKKIIQQLQQQVKCGLLLPFHSGCMSQITHQHQSVIVDVMLNLAFRQEEKKMIDRSRFVQPTAIWTHGKKSPVLEMISFSNRYDAF